MPRFLDLFKARTKKATSLDVERLKEIADIALQSGKLERATELYDALIARKPDHAEAHYKRANALNRLGQWERAIAGYDRAIRLDPKYANAFCNRGVVLQGLNRWDEALTDYDRAIELNSGDFLAYYNRGAVLKELRRFDAALSSYARSIELKGDYVEAYVNRGSLLLQLRRHDSAIASFDEAIKLNSVHVEAFFGRANSLLALKQFDAAIASFDRAAALKADQKYLLGLRRHAQMQICDWQNLQSDLQRIAEAVEAQQPACTPFAMLSLFASSSLHKSAAEIWVREECAPDDSLGPITARARGDKIRIAYCSADFRDHAVSLLLARLFEAHDRSRFEITAVAFGPEANDPVRARLERAFDRFIDVNTQSDVEVARLIRSLGIDIAVDLGGFTECSRSKIFALRAAPIQVSYAGYPGTMGAGYMDYLIADPTILPEEEQHHYAEKIVYMPHCYLPNDPTCSIADTAPSRGVLGLPSAGFVFCCFNNHYKILPSIFESWMRILGRCEDSVLWLSRGHSTAVSNLRKEAARCGIDGNRLVFADRVEPHSAHLARLRVADLFLDTLPYNAHATAIDALWAGLPVLTRIGESFAGRVAASLLRAIDLPELITDTAEQYEQIAVQIACNPERSMGLKQKLARNRLTTRLFDVYSFTKSLEAAYAMIHERHLGGLAPAHVRAPVLASSASP